MRMLFPGMALAAMLAAAGSTFAQATPPSADNAAAAPSAVAHPGDIKAPWQYAPPEQVVAGRDTMDFRREGTLLAKASRDIPKVDESALAQRKLAMYSGERYYRGPIRDSVPAMAAVSTPAAGRRAVSADGDEWTVRFGWLGWTLLGVLVAGVVLAWRKGWFTPFSVRAQERHAARAASARVQSHAAKAPGSTVQLVRRGR